MTENLSPHERFFSPDGAGLPFLFSEVQMQTRAYSPSRSAASVSGIFMGHVYRWMTIGLGVTAFTAYAVASTPSLAWALLGNSLIMIALIIAQIGLVVALSAAIHKFSSGTATGVFLLYALLNGLTLSSIFLVYPIGSIANAFLTCTGMFLAMSVYGTVTKRDLTGMGSFLFMGLIVNIFLASSMLDFVISCVGVIVFTGLTAYDTQKLRQFGDAAPLDDATAIRRGAILGALTRYLAFSNLFLMLLRLFGGIRD